ncbi:MAG: hypothetical protein IJ666_02585 [Ruminococcus sp.]|nr:hypothetical protein [Ruminococcus sp.]
MKKNKDKNSNSNGITISDSIVMSVKKKKTNVRKPEALLIASVGYFSVIMAFLSMFPLKYNKSALIFAAVVFSLFHGIVAAAGKKLLYLNFLSAGAMVFIAYKSIDRIADGFKFIYNTVYKTAYLTEINYYKFLDPEKEFVSVTAFLIFYIWLMALIIYFFTVYHPNTILPLIITFPPIETGLYHGINLPVRYGILVVGYWLALLSMTNTDLGEYSGGTGSFVRKSNVFFPKRQMRFKVTEKCGVYIILIVLVISSAATGVMKATGYERSESINRKRIEIRDAVEAFSMENLAESISGITSAFGFDFEYESHKLGNIDHMKYKNVTDVVVSFDHKYEGAVYLKEYTCSDYADNEWFDFTSDIYKNSIFGNFEDYNIYPQDFPSVFNILMDNDNRYRIDIKSNLKGNKVVSPYGIINTDGIIRENSGNISLEQESKKSYSYTFSRSDISEISSLLYYPIRNIYYPYLLDNSEHWADRIEQYCSEHDLLGYDGGFFVDSEVPSHTDMSSNPNYIMTQLLQTEYNNFVYQNYLKVPENSNMSEVRNEYYDVIENAAYAQTAYEKLATLEQIRDKMVRNVEYSLDPGRTPKNRDFVNYFLLENKKGYCTHYATAGVMLARMAGIPARYASGYIIVGDDFGNANKNNDGSYTIELKDNRSHAWAEIYLDGYGWLPFEFTAGYSQQTIDTTPTTEAQQESTNSVTTAAQENTTEQKTPTTSKNQQSSPSTTTAAAEIPQTETQQQNIEGTPQIPHIPQRVKNIISAVFVTALFLLLVWLRRILMMQLRDRHFTGGSHSARMAYMYEYAEKLIKELGISREQMRYTEYAEAAEEKLGGEYFEKGAFEQFVGCALHSHFSPHEPTDEELQKQFEFVGGLSEKLYEKSSGLNKIVIKYIKALI